ncbi:6189_t:CDS:2 [Entrophospora sp. SA101]|nr:6189_t:CDS:2 [Entrophospora sp. SA101]
MTTEKELKMYTAMPLFVGVFESDNIRTKWRSLPKSNRGRGFCFNLVSALLLE